MSIDTNKNNLKNNITIGPLGISTTHERYTAHTDAMVLMNQPVVILNNQFSTKIIANEVGIIRNANMVKITLTLSECTMHYNTLE